MTNTKTLLILEVIGISLERVLVKTNTFVSITSVAIVIFILIRCQGFCNALDLATRKKQFFVCV